jgi:outer membrane protein TolC
MTKIHYRRVGVFITTLLLCNSPLQAKPMNTSVERKPLGFIQAVRQAQNSDPWLSGNRHQQQALQSLSIAANTLPDPKMSIGFANVAVDSFDFSQEPMSQLKLGISQQFPRGKSLQLKQQQLQKQSEQYPFLRQNRRAQVALTVGTLWLNAYEMQQSIALIEKDKNLFEQLIDITTARYSSTIGQSQQQDIVRAELELSRIEDRLVRLSQQKNGYIGQLNQWLVQDDMQLSGHAVANNYHNETSKLSSELPQIALNQKSLILNKHLQDNDELIRYLSKHPSVIALNKKIMASAVGKNIAQQKYKPEWGVNASYAYREEDVFNNDRSDLFSIGLTFDLPLFTEHKQDQQLKSAISQTEAVKTEKQLRLRQLLGAFTSAKGRLVQLHQRQALYEKKLMPQFHQQADISLNAYTNDTGNFSDVMRAQIDLLNATIDDLGLSVEQQKLHLELNYLFSQASSSDPTGNISRSKE